jgi:hypothetical protein
MLPPVGDAGGAWEAEFTERLRSFESIHPTPGERAVSLKVRVTSGCFHREHSPEAYALIDAHLASMPRGSRPLGFEEHESGPEILLLVTAGLGLLREVVALLAAILKARQKGVERGDRPSEPLELIVRRMDDNGTLREETLLRIGHRDAVDEAQLLDALRGSDALDSAHVDAADAPD